MTCCFTGHRDLPQEGSPEYGSLLLKLEAAVRDAVSMGARRFAVGGAEGFDLLAGEWILTLKRVDPRISLAVYIPCRTQASRFSERNRARYDALLAGADETLLLSDDYHPGCMRERNARMVADADLCIAYVRKNNSGSAQTMKMAERKGIPVFRL